MSEITQDPMIVFDQVTKTYPSKSGQITAVGDLSLNIPQGKITAFVGPSGCGKTTTLRMINRMVNPTNGVIRVDGKDISTVPAPELRRSMGYVLQSAGLLPHRNVVDNIATVLRLEKVPKAQAHERARELLDTVGLPQDFGTRYPAQLSGGQQQRVGVARALAADPPILLMDEPFSAVDPLVRVELQQELLNLQSGLGKTIVFVTHDIDEAMILGDYVAVFAVGGRLAQYATPEEMLRTPADDFVAAFIGKDRGFRELTFHDAQAVTIHQVPQSTEVAPVTEWTVYVDAEQCPQGWLSPHAPGEIFAGGSLFTPGDSLRQALDAALSSPSHLGVAIDREGRLLGVVRAAEVLTAIESTREV